MYKHFQTNSLPAEFKRQRPFFSTQTALFLLSFLHQSYQAAKSRAIVTPVSTETLYSSHNILAVRQNDLNRIVVAFRGTITTEDWIRNLRISIDDGIHKGYSNHYNVNLRTELNQIIMLLSCYPHDEVLITGHSAGSAYAVLFAYDLVNLNLIDLNRILVYTFASPRIAGPRFLSNYRRLGLQDLTFRVRNTEDIIPFMPLAHLSGDDMINLSQILTFPSTFRSSISTLLTGVSALRQLRSSDPSFAHIGRQVLLNIQCRGNILANLIEGHSISNGYFSPLLSTPEGRNFNRICERNIGFCPTITYSCRLISIDSPSEHLQSPKVQPELQFLKIRLNVLSNLILDEPHSPSLRAWMQEFEETSSQIAKLNGYEYMEIPFYLT